MRNIQANAFENVIAIREAVSEKTCTMPFIRDRGGTEGTLSATPQGRAFKVVRTIRLDDVFNRVGWPPADEP